MALTFEAWIGVDLDGTLAKYDGWQGPDHIGEPIPLMVARVKKWLSDGIEVKIFTARMTQFTDLTTGKPADIEPVRNIIEDWCKKHIGQRLEVTNVKDYGMIELWDDRAVGVVPNTGERK